MNRITLIVFFSLLFCQVHAQRIPVAPVQDSTIMIIGGTIHVGNGQVLQNGIITIEKGKITSVGSGVAPKPDGSIKVIQASGKEIYPGLIAPVTDLGLNELELVRATNDYAEAGIFNPGVRALVAYNTDSRAIPTVRSNGILLAQIAPQGGIISGTSSIMQLDAWNWEDGAYKADDGIHLNWPDYFSFQVNENAASVSPNKDYEKQVNDLRSYFSQAQAYNQQTTHDNRNINFEAMKGLFDGSKTLFVHCDYVKEIINAVNFAADFKCRCVIVGGRDSYLCTDVLKQNNVAVILGNVHALPGSDDDDVLLPYETAGLLQKAGVLYALSIYGFWQQRNLPFMAGTTAAYGISKEEALMSITSNAAKILGIDQHTGTIEEGKDANIIISSGDVLDMKTSNIEHAFIQGREINLVNSQKEEYEIYMNKYGLK